MTEPAETSQRSRFGAAAGLVVVCLALLGPFAGKALHVDDPLFVWTARQIAEAPGDFYGFDVNWYGTLEPMFEVNHNPPGFAYAIALWSAAFGDGEPSLHALVFLFAAATVVGTYALGREMGLGAAPLAGVCLLVCPGFLVSATTVMCDVPMLALYVGAIALWVRALRRGERASAIGALVCVSVAGLTKFFAISLVPLLAFYTLVQPRRERRAWGLGLLVPLLLFLAYELLGARLYGTGPLASAAGAATAPHLAGGSTTMARALSAAAFTGGCFAPLLFLAPLLFRARVLLGVVALSLLCAVGLGVAGEVGHHTFAGEAGVRWSLALQCGVMFGGWLLLLLLVVQDLLRRRDAQALLLAAWVVGTLVFVFPVSQFVAGRVVVPLLPAGALLVARRLDAPTTRRRAWVALAASGLLALGVAWADAAGANSVRATAREIAERLAGQPGRIWFQGHWGFQYYLQNAGATAVDFGDDRTSPGDFVVIPENSPNTRAIDGRRVERGMKLERRPSPWLTTMHYRGGAGFYSEVWGPAPFAFGPVPEDVYYIYRLGRPATGKPEER